MNDAKLSALAQREARMRAVEEAARIEAAKTFGILDKDGNAVDVEPEAPPPPADADDADIERRWQEQAAKRNGEAKKVSQQVGNSVVVWDSTAAPMRSQPTAEETLLILRRIVFAPTNPDEFDILKLVEDVLAHPERYRIET